MRVLDLFSGLGGFSQAFKDRGHTVVRVDIEAKFNPDEVVDLRWFEPGVIPGPFDVVLAGVPCDEYARESMPWCRTGKAPDTWLWQIAEDYAFHYDSKWFVIENVRGAQKWHGKAKKKVGQRYFWGRFPPFDAEPNERNKESYSSKQKAERSKVPYEVSLALCLAMEASG